MKSLRSVGMGLVVAPMGALLIACVAVVFTGTSSRASAGICSNWSVDSFEQCGTASEAGDEKYVYFDVDFTEAVGSGVYLISKSDISENVDQMYVQLDGGTSYNITTNPKEFTGVSARSHTFTFFAAIDNTEQNGLAVVHLARGYAHSVVVSSFIWEE